MRLFTALDLPPEVLASLGQLLARLRPAADLRWAPVENLHITTKFIGEWPEARLAELVRALQEIARPGSIPISIRGLGWFPNARAPRVFWAGIEAPPSLAALARAIDQQLAGLGVPRETRPFSPHLTLARIKGTPDLARLRRTIEQLPSTEFGSFVADRYFLYRSELKPTGAVYTKLAEFPLL